MRTEKTQSIRGARGENIALPPPTNYSDVTCRALHVALCAVQIHIAWHSGVMSGDVAMAALEQEVSQAVFGASTHPARVTLGVGSAGLA